MSNYRLTNKLSAPKFGVVHCDKEKIIWLAKFYNSYSGETRPYNNEMISDDVIFVEVIVDGLSVGFGRVIDKTKFFESLLSRRVCVLTEVYIDESYRGAGLFRSLIRHVEVSFGVALIQIASDMASRYRDYYEDLGYSFFIESTDGKMGWLLRNELVGGRG